MANTHQEMINNNVIFMDEESEARKDVLKLQDNDADEVRGLSKLVNFQRCFTWLEKHKQSTFSFQSHKRFVFNDFTRTLEVFQSRLRIYTQTNIMLLRSKTIYF